MTEVSRASVVEIRTSSGTGTGWIYRVDRNGKAWILTNEHVIRGSSTVTVRLSDGSGNRDGTVTGQDGIRDLAVVTICCNARWKPLPTVTSTDIRVGSDVVVMGFPGLRIGAGLSVTTGVVSSYEFHSESRRWLIQTDAAVNPGNSGGPLFNAAGQVIGIVSSRRDPVRSENIGFAISMRTVDEELDYLEVGRGVHAATPTPRATRVPSPGPSTDGVSGVMVHDPHDGSIDCSNDRLDLSVISDSTTDSAAFLRFEAPGIHPWSIGFLYHRPDDERNTYAATIVYGNAHDDIRARHWVKRNGEDVHDPPSKRIQRSLLKTGAGEFNELVFRTSPDGSFLRLNDEIVIEVPASQLVRRNGWSKVCVGFHSDEDDAYSIRYEDLRTRFSREGVSGSLTSDGIDDGKIDCVGYDGGNQVWSTNATALWGVFDFRINASVSKWSVGLLYHDVGDLESGAIVYIRESERVWSRHWNHLDGEWEYPSPRYVRSGTVTYGPTTTHTVEFETASNGTSLWLNGERVLGLRLSELSPRAGGAQICVGFHDDESEPYSVSFSNLWVWTD